MNIDVWKLLFFDSGQFSELYPITVTIGANNRYSVYRKEFCCTPTLLPGCWPSASELVHYYTTTMLLLYYYYTTTILLCYTMLYQQTILLDYITILVDCTTCTILEYYTTVSADMEGRGGSLGFGKKVATDTQMQIETTPFPHRLCASDPRHHRYTLYLGQNNNYVTIIMSQTQKQTQAVAIRRKNPVCYAYIVWGAPTVV